MAAMGTMDTRAIMVVTMAVTAANMAAMVTDMAVKDMAIKVEASIMEAAAITRVVEVTAQKVTASKMPITMAPAIKEEVAMVVKDIKGMGLTMDIKDMARKAVDMEAIKAIMMDTKVMVIKVATKEDIMVIQAAAMEDTVAMVAMEVVMAAMVMVVTTDPVYYSNKFF